MWERKLEWLGHFVPQRNTAGRAEQLRAAGGAILGLLLTGLCSMLVLDDASRALFLIAPIGASAVLVFCLPASPLAQPWPVVGGNVVSALVGVACARTVGDPLLAAPLAVCLAIGVMFVLRCLHPPGGAVALTAVLGGPAVQAAGYQFALLPVALDSGLLVAAALLFNNLTGRRYPHVQHSPMHNVHATRDPVPTARLGFTAEDLDAVLARYGQVLDVSRDDLEQIILETEMQAYGRRFGIITCARIMSRDVVTLEFSTPLATAWDLMRRHQVHALPVLDSARRVIGIVTQTDVLRYTGADAYPSFFARMRALLRTAHGRAGGREVAGRIMTTAVKAAREDTPIVELVPLMANTGLHHIPVVDAEGRFAGIVTQSDLLAALYESRVAGALG